MSMTVEVKALAHFSGSVEFTLVATAIERSNDDSAEADVDVIGTFEAVVDTMDLSLLSTIARADEDMIAVVTVATASLVDTDGSETRTLLLLTNATTSQLESVRLAEFGVGSYSYSYGDDESGSLTSRGRRAFPTGSARGSESDRRGGREALP